MILFFILWRNSHEENTISQIVALFEFDPKFDLETEEFQVYRDGEVYIERQISCPMLRIEGMYPYHIRKP